MSKFLKGLLSATLIFTSLFSGSNISMISISAADSKEYPVFEDAYVRAGGNANRNYNYETITKAHGTQYEGKNIKAISTKNFGGEIISMMKFKLPTKDEVAAGQYNKYEFIFHIFKNADFKNGDQKYQFFYTTDTNWDETKVTWNTKPKDVHRDSTNLLFEFEIQQGDEYEFKTEEEKRIQVDITDKIDELITQGVEEITVFTSAKDALNTSLMMHERTSGNASITENGAKAAKIIASHEEFGIEKLNQLITECETVNAADYTVESYKVFSEVLKEAKAFVETKPIDAKEIRAMYQTLLHAKNGLESVLDPIDPENIAYKKPARSNLNKADVSNVNDGKIDTYWSGKFYPSYVDIDLMDTYDIEEITLYFPAGKSLYYTLYGSNDGKNYNEIHQSRKDEPKTDKGDLIAFKNDCKYRIIRVYIEYTDGDAKSYLSEIKVRGTKQNTNTEELRKGSFEEITKLEAYDKTSYAKPITMDEIYENVYGIIDRTVGAEYRSWFSFEIVPNTKNDYDYFELSTKDGKIHIKGNEGLSLTTGLNYYYKNYVNVQISEQTMQVKMPEKIVPVVQPVRKETPLSVRYAFNYCTLSYTFAFFGEEEWQRENDWLALNGVNVVLDLAGQEATWIKFLMNFGYSYDDAKDWLVGPGYYAWQFMDNMEIFGGPIPDGYVIDRVELARNTQRWKNSLGIQTVLQGYAGMVPTNFKEFYQGNIDVIKQGGWNGFSRPDMIATDSDEYDEFSELFYKAQEFVYGKTSDYYAVDPFHEGGIRPSGLTDDKIAAEVLESMLKYDKDAVWTVQGWQSNPTDSLLKGMGDNREDHVLIVDLIKYPLLSSGEAQYKKNEFNGTSWAWCLLGNFGGNPTMNGEIQAMVNDIQQAKKNSKHMTGLGIISEATFDNPIIYDLIFDLAWSDDTFDLDKWMDNYIERRYGGITDNAKTAWDLMKDSNYNLGVRLHPELFGLRTGGVPRNIGKKNIGYETKNLENALRLLVEDFDKFKDSEAYLYDLTEIMRQVTSNYTVLKYHDVIDARDNKDIEAFRKAKDEFLNAFEVINEVQATQKEQLAGEWIGKAEDRSKNYDDFSNSTFKMNAKSLISTWGSAGGSLIDYGFRTYEGMINDLTKSNWIEYLDQLEENMVHGTPITTPTSSRGYIDKYWKWVISDQNYTRKVKDAPADLKSVSTRVLNECVFTGELDPNIGNIALNRNVLEKGKNNVGNASSITDGKTDKVYIAKSFEDEGKLEYPEVIIDLLAEFDLSKINVVMDYSEEVYYNYEIYVSNDQKVWNKVAEKTSEELQNAKGDVFENIGKNGRFVKIIGIKDSKHMEDPINTEMRIKEIRVYGNQMLPDLEQLTRLIETAENMDISANEEENIAKFNEALKAARTALKELAPPDTVHIVYWDLYNRMIQMNTSGIINVVYQKPITAHNDPSGNSQNLVDGNKGTRWDSGRLSATGKPYEETITPGWAQIDLKGLYEITHLDVTFVNTNIWHQYELYASLDGETWVKLGEKKSEKTPNKDEDTYEIEPQYARYIKMVTTNIQKENSGRRNSYQVGELIVNGKKVIVDFESLNNLISEAKDKKEADYTKHSWNIFMTSLAQAIEVSENDLSMPEDINKANEELKEAMETLVDLTGLQAEIEKSEVLKEADYTVDSWKAVEEALKTMKAVIDKDDATKKDVEYAINANQEAVKHLAVRGNTSALSDLIHSTEEMMKEEYTEGSWKKVEDVLKAAKEMVLDNSNITQIDVVNMMDQLNEAIGQLEKVVPEKADKTELEKAYESAKKLDEKNFTSGSWKRLKEAMEITNKVLSNDVVTQKEVDDANELLASAIQQLEEKEIEEANKTDLKRMLDAVKDYKKEGYTTESWNILIEAMKKAEAVLNNENATQLDINEAINELSKALRQLEIVSNNDTDGDKDHNDTDDNKDQIDADHGNDTGDTTNPMLWLLLCFGAGSAALIMNRKKKHINH